jgi:hypothetical protein
LHHNTNGPAQLDRVLAQATSYARAADRLDGRWHRLATDIGHIAQLPDTRDTPAQASEYLRDDQEVRTICASLRSA